MKFVQFLLIQVVRLWFTVRPTFWKLVAFMTFLEVLKLLFWFLFFNLLDHFSRLLRHVTERLFFVIFFPLTFFCSQSWVLNLSGLELCLIAHLTLILLFTFNSRRFEHFKLWDFLFSLKPSLLLVIKKFQVIPQSLRNLLTHELIFISGERNVFLFFLRVEKAGRSLNRVTVGYVF